MSVCDVVTDPKGEYLIISSMYVYIMYAHVCRRMSTRDVATHAACEYLIISVMYVYIMYSYVCRCMYA